MNLLRTALDTRPHLLGMQSFSANSAMVEILGFSGFDWVCIDLEHALTTLREVEAAVRAARASDMMAFVRVPELDPGLVGRVLDLGVDGIVVPHVESISDINAAIDAAYYPPRGNRSACSSVRGARYGLTNWREHTDSSNTNVSIIPLLESPEAFEHLEELLAAPDEVPVYWVGGRDLAQHLGMPGADLLAPELQVLCKDLLGRASARGKAVMATVSPHLTTDYANALKSLGFRLLSFGTDETVFARTCRDIVAEVL